MRAGGRLRRTAWRLGVVLLSALLLALLLLDDPGDGWDAGVSAAPWRPVCVQLGTVMPDEAFPWERETTGLLLAMLEGGFAMLDDATVAVDGTAPPPGRPACEVDTPTWTARLELGGAVKDLHAALWLCDPRHRCRILRANGVRDEPQDLASSLLTQTAKALDRDPTVALAWTTRQSRDPYAQLLSGRAAAVTYGLLPPAPPPRKDEVAAVRRDALDHAHLVDPRMPIAAWMVGRRALDAGNGPRALGVMVRGDREGADPVDLALAETEQRHGRPADAVARLDAVQQAMPDDHRIALERAAALIAGRRLERASQVLHALPPEMADMPRWLEVAITWREAAGERLDPDGLLALWQSRAPDDPRPVRKRITVLVGEDRFADALGLTAELASRGPFEEAGRLKVALAAELGSWQEAADAARALGDVVLAEALLGPPAPTSKKLEPVQSEALLAAARADLEAGDADAAVKRADRLLAADPWSYEALTLRADAYTKLGDDAHARADTCKLRQLDPAHGDRSSTGADSVEERIRCEKAG